MSAEVSATPRRPVARAMFDDLPWMAGVEVVSLDKYPGQAVFTFSRDLTDAERAEVVSIVESGSEEDRVHRANAQVLRARAEAALVANRTHLARTSPTAAQIAEQVRLLTQENVALIRLMLGKLDETD